MSTRNEDTELDEPDDGGRTIGFDPERQLLRKQRTVLMVDHVDDALARRACEDIFLLTSLNSDPIKLIISTNGGSVLAMFTIIDSICHAQRAGILVEGYVIGRAMSAGFMILQKCDRRVMLSHGYLMAHGTWGFSAGDIKDKEAELNWEKDIRDKMSTLVAERNTSDDAKYHDSDFWRSMLTENTPVFLNATQAVEWGLIDEVEGRE